MYHMHMYMYYMLCVAYRRADEATTFVAQRAAHTLLVGRAERRKGANPSTHLTKVRVGVRDRGQGQGQGQAQAQAQGQGQVQGQGQAQG